MASQSAPSPSTSNAERIHANGSPEPHNIPLPGSPILAAANGANLPAHQDIPLPGSPLPAAVNGEPAITNPNYKPFIEQIHHRNKHDHHGKPRAEENEPNRFELFTLGEGEKKVEEIPDTRVPSTSIFLFNKEDHTLGNLLRDQLLKNKHVVFSAYKVPHPLFSTFELRVGTDAEIAPRAALVQACRELVNDLGTLSREFAKEYELRKMAGPGAAGNDDD